VASRAVCRRRPRVPCIGCIGGTRCLTFLRACGYRRGRISRGTFEVETTMHRSIILLDALVTAFRLKVLREFGP
jgi:hypothetical protein